MTTVKVCLLGSSCVGKSSLALRFAEGIFDSQSSCTIGGAFLRKDLTTKKGTLYHLQIWDTAGQEKYRAIAPMYYRGSSVVLIVYDITKRGTLYNDARMWIEELKNYLDITDRLLVLVGNKTDLKRNRAVPTVEAEYFAKKYGALCWETSAKTGFNVEDVFADIRSNLDKRDLTKIQAPISVPIKKSRLSVKTHDGKQVEETSSKSGCCN